VFRFERPEEDAMSLWEDLDSRARRLGILETKLAQGAAMCLALVIAKLVPQLLELSVWWFVVAGAACAIRPSIVFSGGARREGAA
jgi:hypothetical protein